MTFYFQIDIDTFIIFYKQMWLILLHFLSDYVDKVFPV